MDAAVVIIIVALSHSGNIKLIPDKSRLLMGVRILHRPHARIESLFTYDNDSFILYPYVMEGVQQTTVRVHVRGAKALTVPAAGGLQIRLAGPRGQKLRIEPLYVRKDEAVFELPAVPGQYIIYQIER